MNYKKAYSDIISEILKRKTDGGRLVTYDEMDGTDYIAVTTTGTYAYIFSKRLFLIDKATMIPTTAISKAYERRNLAELLTWTGVVKQNKKAMVIELKSDDGNTVLLNEKVVKLFGKPSDLTFMTEGHLTPVFVYEKDFFIGIIMPVIAEVKNDENH